MSDRLVLTEECIYPKGWSFRILNTYKIILKLVGNRKPTEIFEKWNVIFSPANCKDYTGYCTVQEPLHSVKVFR